MMTSAPTASPHDLAVHLQVPHYDLEDVDDLQSLLITDLLPGSGPERTWGWALPLALAAGLADAGGVRPAAGSRVNMDIPL
jgi:hypothetical protein